MREPAARRDNREIDLPAPPRERRPAVAARRRPVPETGAVGETLAVLGALGRRAGLLCLRRPGAVFGGIAIVGIAAVVSVNALGYQTGRHPAPIFPKPLPRQEAARRPVAADVPATRPVEKAQEAKAPDTRPVEKPEPPRQAARDAIGELIRSTETTASVSPRAKAEPHPEPAVSQAQRALAKLGYGPLKADGMMGAATRAAIEKFERDRKLPVTGAAAGRTLRELAARSAVPPG